MFGLNRGEIKEGRTSYVMIFLIEICMNCSYDDQSFLRSLEMRTKKGVAQFVLESEETRQLRRSLCGGVC